MLKKCFLGVVEERTTWKFNAGKFLYHNKHTVSMVGSDFKKSNEEIQNPFEKRLIFKYLNTVSSFN